MAYITTADLSARLGAAIYARLTDRVNGTTPSSAVAGQIVAEAEAEADAYLAQRYQTPVIVAGQPAAAQLLAARVLDLAEYRAWKGSPFVGDPPHRVKLLYADALRWWEAVATGQAALPAPGVARAAPDGGPAQSSAARVFTTDGLQGL
jgi:phage gp36-like protein